MFISVFYIGEHVYWLEIDHLLNQHSHVCMHLHVYADAPVRMYVCRLTHMGHVLIFMCVCELTHIGNLPTCYIYVWLVFFLLILFPAKYFVAG